MTQPEQGDMERVRKDAESQGWSFADELAERLYRGIAGFTKEFTSHADISSFISAALSDERQRAQNEAYETCALICENDPKRHYRITGGLAGVMRSLKSSPPPVIQGGVSEKGVL